MSALVEQIAEVAVGGAKAALDSEFDFEGGAPEVVVTVIWKNTAGTQLVIASAIPDRDDVDRSMLADSLRRSAEEADE